MITTGEHVYHGPRWRDGQQVDFSDQGALACAMLYADGVVRVPGVTKGEALVYVNHGQWVVDCPFDGCHAAQTAFATDKRFLCHLCLNSGGGGAWVTVRWPSPQKRSAIERVLADRARRYQNWMPHETVAELAAENDAFGVLGAG